MDTKLAGLADNVLFGDIWERLGLSKHGLSLITVAALIALNRPDQLRSHSTRVLADGGTLRMASRSVGGSPVLRDVLQTPR